MYTRTTFDFNLVQRSCGCPMLIFTRPLYKVKVKCDYCGCLFIIKRCMKTHVPYPTSFQCTTRTFKRYLSDVSLLFGLLAHTQGKLQLQKLSQLANGPLAHVERLMSWRVNEVQPFHSSLHKLSSLNKFPTSLCGLWPNHT